MYTAYLFSKDFNPHSKLKISAYIPCFNNECTIGTAIESILNQNYPVDELIIIDDGSSDNSLNIIKRYGVKLISLKENKGRGFVRNLAVKESKNELILCCDATNSLDVNFLSIAFKHLNDNPDICSVSESSKQRHKWVQFVGGDLDIYLKKASSILTIKSLKQHLLLMVPYKKKYDFAGRQF